jgi:hypothetical protein
MPKMLNDMNCLEALEALEEGLEALNLPEFRLIQTYILQARVAHTEEIDKLKACFCKCCNGAMDCWC